MAGNSFGRIFKLTSFGESHGQALGGVIDGCPAGIKISEELIQRELDLRRPGQKTASSTSRQEKDLVQLLSGVFEGQTTGTPIGFCIFNQDQRSRDYSQIQDTYRPGHADYTYEAKFGIRDYRGGGRSSARETVSRVVAGAVAQELLKTFGIQVTAHTAELGGIRANPCSVQTAQERPYCAPDPEIIALWEEKINKTKQAGDSLGGIVEIRALGVPSGWGEPVFDKLDARLAYALMGVGAVKAVEIGSGLEAARLLGSENNDPLTDQGFSSNNAGGILGGISNGESLVIRAAIKPIPSISMPQKTVKKDGSLAELTLKGRHDICAIPRINPVLKSMVLLVLADMCLLQKARSNWS